MVCPLVMSDWGTLLCRLDLIIVEIGTRLLIYGNEYGNRRRHASIRSRGRTPEFLGRCRGPLTHPLGRVQARGAAGRSARRATAVSDDTTAIAHIGRGVVLRSRATDRFRYR